MWAEPSLVSKDEFWSTSREAFTVWEEAMKVVGSVLVGKGVVGGTAADCCGLNCGGAVAEVGATMVSCVVCGRGESGVLVGLREVRSFRLSDLLSSDTMLDVLDGSVGMVGVRLDWVIGEEG